MNKLMGLATGFVILSILAFLGVNWVSTVPPPSNTSSPEYAVYDNLTETQDIAYTGQEGVILLVIVAMIFAGVFVLMRFIKK